MVASVGIGRDPATPVLPLAMIKLNVAALWWDRELGDIRLADPRRGAVSVHEMLVAGLDKPGEELKEGAHQGERYS